MNSATPDVAIQAVVFDLDGLMVNTESLYRQVGTEILRRRGKVCTREMLDAMMGRPPKDALQVMIDWHALEATVDQLEEETRELFVPILRERLAPMPGLTPLLEALERRSIPKAIATSSRRSFVDEVFERFEWHARFEFVLTSEDVSHGKPHPEIYLAAAARLSLKPARVLVLEDSQTGCKAAVSAGTFVVAVPGEHSAGHDFTGAALVADTLADPRIYQVLDLAAGPIGPGG